MCDSTATKTLNLSTVPYDAHIVMFCKSDLVNVIMGNLDTKRLFSSMIEKQNWTKNEIASKKSWQSCVLMEPLFLGPLFKILLKSKLA